LWGMKGHAGTIEDVDVKVNLLEQKVSHIPNDQWHTVYTPDRIAIQTNKGVVLEEMYSPRLSYFGHTMSTPWSNLQLAYFAGYAMWNYFNTPYQFTRPGFVITEIEPWNENGEAWRRLQVRWPKEIHTHSREQTFYINADNLISRLDYEVEVAGNVLCAHYLSNYKEVSGIKLATRRVVYLKNRDNTPDKDSPVIVSIELSNIVFN
ncbi:MAG TPA: hypothetical protein VFZ52_23195, partial [Chryseolinea sp.]